ncbi:hypothetical protein KL86DES1_21298 [uncultured Desulfovibrio sp.]|uniref:Uncharacterized protein n=1 Tax=uncultured Desulfovibrio sp. TaxID=167968 RepID=A0A212L7C0_9BACT|nr:hypothetical protein KL86DES1_21298 [uncultured Desulfovibrio sp.]VZH34194.1 conserved protein of unknown function [Desulfovibrio sp. 86]
MVHAPYGQRLALLAWRGILKCFVGERRERRALRQKRATVECFVGEVCGWPVDGDVECFVGEETLLQKGLLPHAPTP